MNKIYYNKGGIIIKKIFISSFTLIIFTISILNVNASMSSKAKIGNNYYDTFEEAINAATSKDTIILTNNVVLNDTQKINKTVNINLNNNNIESTEQVFLIEGGSLNLTGNGTIRETKPYYGAITLKGSQNKEDKNYSTVNIDKNVNLEGWSGIFIDHNDNKTGYGILVNLDGSINAINDINGGTGIGVYVNGNIKHEENSPIINLNENAKITSTGNGIYSAGYATYNINGAYIEGVESAIGIKSGIVNIINGTIIGTGQDKTPTSGNNNGINPSGVAIQLESNKSYKGNIELNIKNGTIKSKNSNVIYEYTTNNSNTQVKNINLSGGTYTSDSQKPVFVVSNSFKNTHNNFITGGTYSSDPTTYLETGYQVELENSLYKVIQNTINVFKEQSNTSNKTIYTIITVSSLFIISTYIFLKNKISII